LQVGASTWQAVGQGGGGSAPQAVKNSSGGVHVSQQQPDSVAAKAKITEMRLDPRALAIIVGSPSAVRGS
jgi:hypothetical protein